MARKRPWRSGLTPIPVSPMPPSPARPSDGPGPGPHPPVPPILRGGGRSAAPGGRRAITLSPRIAAGGYGGLPGRCREQAGQDLLSECIRGDLDRGCPRRLRQPRTSGGGGGGEPPTPGPAADHGGAVASSGLPAARHSPRLDSVGSAAGDDAPAAHLGARRPRVLGRRDSAHTGRRQPMHWPPTGSTSRCGLWPPTAGGAGGLARVRPTATAPSRLEAAAAGPRGDPQDPPRRVTVLPDASCVRTASCVSVLPDGELT